MAHQHYQQGSELEGCTEVGSGVCLREWRNDAGELIRFVIGHDRPESFTMPDGTHPTARCEGSIPVTGAHAWSVSGTLAGGDLTLSPSILEPADHFCPGQHGWIRDGKWVPA